MNSGKLRLRFSKTGRAKYISHLDLMATMRRALLRAGVKLRYTQGFNPHPVMSIALPLSVGTESVCELMDFIPLELPLVLEASCLEGMPVLEDDLPQALNNFLPEGISVLEAYVSERKFNAIAWIEIAGRLYYETKDSTLVEKLRERFAAESIIISKRTKRGETEIDIVPFIRDVAFHDGETIEMTAKISAQNPSLNPENLISALSGIEGLTPDFSAFRRAEVFDADMNIFR